MSHRAPKRKADVLEETPAAAAHTITVPTICKALTLCDDVLLSIVKFLTIREAYHVSCTHRRWSAQFRTMHPAKWAVDYTKKDSGILLGVIRTSMARHVYSLTMCQGNQFQLDAATRGFTNLTHLDWSIQHDMGGAWIFPPLLHRCSIDFRKFGKRAEMSTIHNVFVGLAKCTNLRILSLGFGDVGKTAVVPFEKVNYMHLAPLQKLTHFQLRADRAETTIPLIESLIQFLRTQSTLTSLRLFQGKTTRGAWMDIILTMPFARQLVALGLGNLHMSEESLLKMVTAFPNLTELAPLSMAITSFDFARTCKPCTYLRCAHNPAVGNVPLTVFAQMHGLNHIRRLALSHHGFTSVELTHVLRQMRSLRHLELLECVALTSLQPFSDPEYRPTAMHTLSISSCKSLPSTELFRLQSVSSLRTLVLHSKSSFKAPLDAFALASLAIPSIFLPQLTQCTIIK
jgi:hypothetical protein